MHVYDVVLEEGTIWDENNQQKGRKGDRRGLWSVNVVRVLDILECKYNYTIHPLYNEYKLKKFVLKYVEIFIKNTVIKKKNHIVLCGF